MSKVKNNKVKLNYLEITVINLEKFLNSAAIKDNQIENVKSLLSWFKLNGYFTKAQMSLAKSLTYVKKKPAVVKKHYLYAISNGEQVKLGMSSNVNGRLKALQTSSPSELVLLWKYYIANTSAEAIKIEKMLHRACKEFHIRGEWFKMECIDTVNKFNPNKKHSAKWEYAKIISVERARKKGILNFTVEDIRRTRITSNMNRVWAQTETDELYQYEIVKLLDDGHVVLVTHP